MSANKNAIQEEIKHDSRSGFVPTTLFFQLLFLILGAGGTYLIADFILKARTTYAALELSTLIALTGTAGAVNTAANLRVSKIPANQLPETGITQRLLGESNVSYGVSIQGGSIQQGGDESPLDEALATSQASPYSRASSYQSPSVEQPAPAKDAVGPSCNLKIVAALAVASAVLFPSAGVTLAATYLLESWSLWAGLTASAKATALIGATMTLGFLVHRGTESMLKLKSDRKSPNPSNLTQILCQNARLIPAAR